MDVSRFLHPRFDPRLVLAVAAVAAVAAPLVVLERTASEPPRSDRPTATAPTAPSDPALAQWEFLIGGAPASTTRMAAEPTVPIIRQLPVAQYRSKGARRVYRERPPEYRPVAVVLHATGGGTPGSGFASLGALWRFFQRPAADAASHFAIDRAGRIAQFVPVEYAAFHVATPGWNDVSIGIELLNDNTGEQPFTTAQLRAATQLVRWLGAQYDIPLEGVVRHRTVQPVDRSDPASNFPWRAWTATLTAPTAIQR